MSRWLNFFMMILILTSFSVLIWKGHQKVTFLRGNREFCQHRLELAELNRSLLIPLEKIWRHPSLIDIYQKRVGQELCKQIKGKTKSWTSYRDHLSGDNLFELDLADADLDDPRGCHIPASCAGSLVEFWEGFYPDLLFPKFPPKIHFSESKLRSWGQVLQELNIMMPKVEAQYEKDISLLCSLADDFYRTQKIFEYLNSRPKSVALPACSGCVGSQVERKLNQLRENQQRHLRQNLQQFTMKWSNSQAVKLSCLKDFIKKNQYEKAQVSLSNSEKRFFETVSIETDRHQ